MFFMFLLQRPASPHRFVLIPIMLSWYLCFGIEEIEQILIVNRSMEICRYRDGFALQMSYVPLNP